MTGELPSSHPSSQEVLWDKKHDRGEHLRENANPFAGKAFEYFTQGSKVLDIGCGVGMDASLFAHSGHEVLATDISSVVIEQNKEHFQQENLKFAPLDASQNPLPFNDGEFDAVYSHLALHYYDDETTRAIFSELHRILKDEGLLAFACKSVDDPNYGIGEEVEKDMFVVKGHVRHFFSTTYVKELLQGKFDVELLQDRREDYNETSSAFVWCVAKKRTER